MCVGQCRVDCKKDNLSLFKLWPWVLARAISPMAARGIQSVGLSHVAVYLFIHNKLFSQGCEHFFFFFSFFLLFCCCCPVREFWPTQNVSNRKVCLSRQEHYCPLSLKKVFQNSNWTNSKLPGKCQLFWVNLASIWCFKANCSGVVIGWSPAVVSRKRWDIMTLWL